MKKIIALVLTLTLSLSLGINAFAANSTTESGDVVVEVKGVAQAGVTYNVTISWDSLTFTYDFKETAKTWNPETHSYDIATSGDAAWNKTAAQVTVTNHSNGAVKVNATFGTSTTLESNGVKATLSNAVYTLNSAEGTAVGSAPSGATTVTISGAPADKSGFKLGTITLTVDPA